MFYFTRNHGRTPCYWTTYSVPSSSEYDASTDLFLWMPTPSQHPESRCLGRCTVLYTVGLLYIQCNSAANNREFIVH